MLLIPKSYHPESATALARYLQKCNCACMLPAEVFCRQKFSDCTDADLYVYTVNNRGGLELATSAIVTEI